MELLNNLPVYTMDVNPDLKVNEGVDFVALVSKPAIKKHFMRFKEDATGMEFTIASDERRIISGPLMLADTPLYRNEDGEEFYVTFPKEAIERCVRKYFSQGNHANFNQMHDSEQKVEGVVMFESFISDESRGILPMKGFEDTPQGSWFVSLTIDNDEVWASIKDGTFKGLSVEGFFSRIATIEGAEIENFWEKPDYDLTDEQRDALRQMWDILENTEG